MSSIDPSEGLENNSSSGSDSRFSSDETAAITEQATTTISNNRNSITEADIPGSLADQLARVDLLRIDSDETNSTCVASDECPPYGMVSFIGRRKEMEDSATAVRTFFSLPCDGSISNGLSTPNSAFHFFGVYDGHGGSEAAIFCKDRLHHALVEEMKSSISANGTNDTINWDEHWERAMVSSFLKIDSEIGGLCPKGGAYCEKCDRNGGSCLVPIAPDTVGSTAVVAVVGCCRIIIANCGDSRVVISRAGRAVPLSDDHKPERRDEFERIERAGGRVIAWNGNRVMGMLAMSRAIGDRYLKPYIIADPEVRCIRRTEEDEFLILASDGLWDVLSNEQVCDAVRQCLAGRCPSNVMDGVLSGHVYGMQHSNARVAAAYLTRLAYSRRSSDNISVLVVDLKKVEAASADAVISPSHN